MRTKRIHKSIQLLGTVAALVPMVVYGACVSNRAANFNNQLAACGCPASSNGSASCAYSESTGYHIVFCDCGTAGCDPDIGVVENMEIRTYTSGICGTSSGCVSNISTTSMANKRLLAAFCP